MSFTVLAADSLGVRSLAVWVSGAAGGNLLIDPGAALGPRRHGLPPHHQEEQALAAAEARLVDFAARSERVVITHFHHDHFVPFARQRWIASGKRLARAVYRDKVVFLRDPEGPINPRQRGRARRMASDLDRHGIHSEPADDRKYGDLCFSPPFRHGDDDSPGGWVVMVRVITGQERLVHMSDTQLLNAAAIDWALRQRPSVVITAGPPLYLPQMQPEQEATAQSNLCRLVEMVPQVVVDHHLRRGGDAETFLAEAGRIADLKGHRLESAASSRGEPDRLLEAQRWELHGRHGHA